MGHPAIVLGLRLYCPRKDCMGHPPMNKTTSQPEVLNTRATLIFALIFLLYETVWSWMSLSKSRPFPRDILHIFGLAVAIFVSASVASRSKLTVDRFVFGTATAVFVLVGAELLPVTTNLIRLIEVAKGIMWTIAAVAGIIALGRTPHRQQN
jgi:hypothetical protein